MTKVKTIVLIQVVEPIGLPYIIYINNESNLLTHKTKVFYKSTKREKRKNMGTPVTLSDHTKCMLY